MVGEKLFYFPRRRGKPAKIEAESADEGVSWRAGAGVEPFPGKLQANEVIDGMGAGRDRIFPRRQEGPVLRPGVQEGAEKAGPEKREDRKAQPSASGEEIPQKRGHVEDWGVEIRLDLEWTGGRLAPGGRRDQNLPSSRS